MKSGRSFQIQDSSDEIEDVNTISQILSELNNTGQKSELAFPLKETQEYLHDSQEGLF